ncbi:MAG: hypothetical protein U9P11_03935 [Pseudomonadota bacterium]|nr:hypothetical protein [Pseudomonadota bacterium]
MHKKFPPCQAEPEDMPGQWTVTLKDVARCPCNDCHRRSDCRSECDRFRAYVWMGK